MLKHKRDDQNQNKRRKPLAANAASVRADGATSHLASHDCHLAFVQRTSGMRRNTLARAFNSSTFRNGSVYTLFDELASKYSSKTLSASAAMTYKMPASHLSTNVYHRWQTSVQLFLSFTQMNETPPNTTRLVLQSLAREMELKPLAFWQPVATRDERESTVVKKMRRVQTPDGTGELKTSDAHPRHFVNLHRALNQPSNERISNHRQDTLKRYRTILSNTETLAAAKTLIPEAHATRRTMSKAISEKYSSRDSSSLSISRRETFVRTQQGREQWRDAQRSGERQATHWLVRHLLELKENESHIALERTTFPLMPVRTLERNIPTGRDKEAASTIRQGGVFESFVLSLNSFQQSIATTTTATAPRRFGQGYAETFALRPPARAARDSERFVIAPNTALSPSQMTSTIASNETTRATNNETTRFIMRRVNGEGGERREVYRAEFDSSTVVGRTFVLAHRRVEERDASRVFEGNAANVLRGNVARAHVFERNGAETFVGSLNVFKQDASWSPVVTASPVVIASAGRRAWSGRAARESSAPVWSRRRAEVGIDDSHRRAIDGHGAAQAANVSLHSGSTMQTHVSMSRRLSVRSFVDSGRLSLAGSIGAAESWRVSATEDASMRLARRAVLVRGAEMFGEEAERRFEVVAGEIASLRGEATLRPPKLGYVFAQTARPTTATEPSTLTQANKKAEQREMVEVVRREVETAMSAGSPLSKLSRADYTSIAEQVYSTLVRRLVVERERLGLHAR